MKYLIVLLVVIVGAWLLLGRRRGGQPPQPPTSKSKAGKAAVPQAMLACAHCGVHLPQSDAVADAAGRSFCSEAHRLAGPR